ncbi:MAG: putative O-glycosylation ligase, exosortase A system-associated, partial [Candidatus Acidiferrum sp.]
MRALFFFVTILAMLPVTFINPYVGVILWCWFSFMNPHKLTYGFTETLPFALVIGIVTVVAWMTSRDRKWVPWDITTALIALFILDFSITTIYALAPDAAYEKWDLTLKTCLFLFVTAALTTNRIRVHAFVWITVISLGYYGLKGGLFALRGGGANRIFGPEHTMIFDNNHLAVGLLMAVPLMNYLRLHSRLPLIRYGCMGAMSFTILAVLQSYSRGAALALAAMVIFFWWNSRRKPIVALVLAVSLSSAVAFMPSAWMDRILTIENYQQDSSAEGRLTIWQAAMDIAIARPLVGAGFLGPYQQEIVDIYSPGVTARAVHSIYFEVLGEHGFPGFAIWLSLGIAAFANCVYIRRRTKNIPQLRWANDLSRMCFVSLIAYFTGGAFLSLS